MTDAVLQAEAKLTVSLHMVGIRSDGYHLLESEMVSLDLSDALELNPDGDGLILHPESTVRVDVSADNLINRALRLVDKRCGVTLRKNIPVGAGLGGGSADAAAILRWADEQDPLVGAKLGADVPFCMRGGRALVSGIGEIVEPLGFQPRNFTLLTPPIHVDTKSVYQAFDELGPGERRADNDLESAAVAVAPELGLWRDRLADWTGQQPHLAGSGATWFVEGHHSVPTEENVQKARWVLASTTPGFF